MRIWPDSGSYFDWMSWADALVGVLRQKEREENNTLEVGQIGEFVMLPSKGWLLADGSDFDSVSFPVLAKILGGNVLPNLSPQYDPTYVVGIRAG